MWLYSIEIIVIFFFRDVIIYNNKINRIKCKEMVNLVLGLWELIGLFMFFFFKIMF